MKYVLVIPDGMGDNPVASLGGKTPLDAAKTPNMDFFASQGVVGESHNIPDGYIPGTDIGCMSVFGYDPRVYFTGRGPLEAAEQGILLKKGELAFRCNLVTTSGDEMKDFSADHISTKEAAVLLSSLNKSIRKDLGKRVHFFPGDGTGYRNLMILKLSDSDIESSVCTPPHDIMGKPYKKYLPKGPKVDILLDLMERSRVLFENHPVNLKRKARGKGAANMIWLWGQGRTPNFPSYEKKYGIKGGVITAVDLVKGIALHAGLKVVRVPGVTGFFDTNYTGKAEYALKTLKKSDLAVIHIESTDEAGHMGDAKLKIKAIEDVDRLVLGTLRKGLKKLGPHKVMVLPDHYTCTTTRTHSSAPVPFLIYSSLEPKKGPSKFSENAARGSQFKVAEGYRLMDFFIKGIGSYWKT